MQLYVCLFVCLTNRIKTTKTNGSSYTKFLSLLPEAMARSCFGGVAIRCVLPVLWTTSCLHILARHVCAYDSTTVPLRPEVTTDNRKPHTVRIRSCAIAEGPREALVSRNPATTKHLT